MNTLRAGRKDVTLQPLDSPGLVELVAGWLAQKEHTWVVEGNPSVRALERLNFRYIGRQRQCHYTDGRSYDRLWFDLLASEHKDLD